MIVAVTGSPRSANSPLRAAGHRPGRPRCWSRWRHRADRPRSRTVLGVLGLALLVAALVFLVYSSWRIITWLLIALFLAMALNPAVEFFERRGLRRVFAALIVLVLAVAVIAGFLYLVLPPLIDQIAEFVDAVPGLVEELTRGEACSVSRTRLPDRRADPRGAPGSRARQRSRSDHAGALDRAERRHGSRRGRRHRLPHAVHADRRPTPAPLDGGSSPRGPAGTLGADGPWDLQDGRRLRVRQPADQLHRVHRGARHPPRDRRPVLVRSRSWPVCSISCRSPSTSPP